MWFSIKKYITSITKQFNQTLGLTSFLIGISTFNHGFDNQGFSTTLAMDSFAKQFGVYDATTNSYSIPPHHISLFNSLHYIGNIAGLYIGSYVSSCWGRKTCMFSMSCLALGSATLVVTSKTMEQMLVARVLNYVYVGMELAVVPNFQSEITPAEVRGFIGCTYVLSMVTGGLVMNSICNVTSELATNLAWKIPLSLFFPIPTTIALGVWFVPESPRWLLQQNRDEDAEKSLRRLRTGTLDAEKISRDFEILKLAARQMPKWGSFKECFRKPNWKRLAIVMCVNLLQQITGGAFVGQYGAIFVKSTFSTGRRKLNPFDFTVWNMGTLLLFTIVNMVLNDRIGRRPLLLAGSVVQTAALFTLAGLGTVSHATFGTKSASVAMLSVFSAGLALGWAPLTFVITSELIDLRLRDQSSRIAYTINMLTSFSVNFSIPYLMDKKYLGLDSRVGYVFGPLALGSIFFVYFCVPECKGKSLEEVDALFRQGVRLRDFKKTDPSPVQSDDQEMDSNVEMQSVLAEAKEADVREGDR